MVKVLEDHEDMGTDGKLDGSSELGSIFVALALSGFGNNRPSDMRRLANRAVKSGSHFVGIS